MSRRKTFFGLLIAVLLLCLQHIVAAKPGASRQKVAGLEAVIWRNPGDIASRDLFYGSGGRENMPHGPYVFLDEDLSGTNAKFDVRDRDGIKWQVKLGMEARPETAASRLLWAVGYPTADYYFFPEIRVEHLPGHLHRGQDLVAPGGTVRDVRLKRHPGEKKIGHWHWRSNPFVATREYNGLRVMMALVNDWDLKDDNNSIYQGKDPAGLERSVDLYMVTDLGASFGGSGHSWPAGGSKGNLNSFGHSTFIHTITHDEVDFGCPARPALFYLVDLPDFIRRMDLRWLGKNIPITDSKWIGALLGRLSAEQIRDAFRAAGYAPSEVEGFTQIIRERIAELNRLSRTASGTDSAP